MGLGDECPNCGIPFPCRGVVTLARLSLTDNSQISALILILAGRRKHQVGDLPIFSDQCSRNYASRPLETSVDFCMFCVDKVGTLSIMRGQGTLDECFARMCHNCSDVPHLEILFCWTIRLGDVMKFGVSDTLQVQDESIGYHVLGDM